MRSFEKHIVAALLLVLLAVSARGQGIIDVDDAGTGGGDTIRAAMVKVNAFAELMPWDRCVFSDDFAADDGALAEYNSGSKSYDGPNNRVQVTASASGQGVYLPSASANIASKKHIAIIDVTVGSGSIEVLSRGGLTAVATITTSGKHYVEYTSDDGDGGSGDRLVLIATAADTFYINALHVFVSNDTPQLAGVETVADYDALRALDGTAYTSAFVNVADSTYTFGSASYTTIGGIFRRVASGTENGGTIIRATDGTIWERVWDGVAAQPEWWEVGGVDSGGNSYDNYSSGDGVANESDRIISANQISATIKLVPGKEYILPKSLLLKPNTYIQGNYATFKRADKLEATITAVTSLTEFTVDDITPFRVGDGILVTDGGTTYDDSKTSLRTVSAISGNTITISGNLLSAAAVSDKVYPEVIMLRISGTDTAGSRNYKFENLIFDGNKANNDHTVSWQNQYTGLLGANTSFINCEFFDIPTENIIAPDCLMDKCRFKNLNGSIVHISGKTEYNDTLVGGQTVVRNCVGDGFNLGTQAAMDHSEGLIVFSAIPEAIKIDNCRFKNGSEGIVGNVGTRTDFINIRNSRFESFKFIADFAATSSAMVDDIWLLNNTFVQCGRIDLRYGRNSDDIVTATAGYRNVKVLNNEFRNTQMAFASVINLAVNDNQLFVDSGDTPSSDAASLSTAIDVTNCDQVSICGNTLEGFATYNTRLLNGISVNVRNSDNQSPDDPITSHWMTNVNICRNTLSNFQKGITCDYAVPPIFTVPVRNWQIANNKVYMLGDASNQGDRYGIIVPPGAVASCNTVVAQAVYANSRCIGMLAMGIDDSGDTDNYLGSIVHSNVVEGTFFEAIRIGGRNTGDNEYNVTCVNNITNVAIVASGTSSETLSGNVTVTLPSSYTVPSLHAEVD